MDDNSIIFGTDGIRGRAGEYPFTPRSIRRIAFGIGRAVLDKGGNTILIGRDPRESSTWIEAAIIEGLRPLEIQVWLSGMVPTSAISCAMPKLGAHLGIMITASHNPWHDNGIKCFGEDGTKISSYFQNKITASIEQVQEHDLLATQNPSLDTDHSPTSKRDQVLDIWESYMPPLQLEGLTILLDAANGASSNEAPRILENLGATVIRRGCAPNGKNINDKVGALHPPEDIGKADIAICLDGDGDRVILVDQNGTLDGDDMLFLLRQATTGPIVGTIMSNGGLDKSLDNRLLRSKVGDRYVAEMMKDAKADIGGESSGHMLFTDGMPTGDGLYSALRVFQSAGLPPWENPRFPRWPSATSNIRYKGYKKVPLEELSSLDEAKEDGHRLVVRYSGTEPKLRILVEGERAEFWCNHIATEFQSKMTPSEQQ